jgi:hypothetical protein
MESRLKTSYLSSAELLALAKASYAQKKYEDALDSLLAARKTSNSRNMELDILDYLAAVQEKLEAFDKAIRHGKEMIQLEPSNARGYLRVGRTLQKSGKSSFEEKILPIYNRGVDKVSTTDANLPLLKKLRDAYLKKLHSTKTSDPFGALPLELILDILAYCSFPQVVSCIRVSKGWKGLLTSQASLWRTMDLTTIKRGFVNQNAVKHFIRWSNYNLKVAKMGRFDHFSTMWNMLDSCKHIHTLNIDARSSTVRSNLVRICQKVKNLQSFTCRELQSIEDINIVMKYLSHIEEIRFEDMKYGPDASRFRIFPAPNISYEKLKTFKMGSHPDQSTRILIQKARFDTEFFESAPLLETLILSRVNFSAQANWASLTKLKCLEIDNCYFVDGGDMVLPSSIESFKLHSTRGPRPRTVGSELPNQASVPNLKELHYEQCQWGPGIVEMLLSGWTEDDQGNVGSRSRGAEALSGEAEEPPPSNLKTLKVMGCYWHSADTARQIFRQVNDFDEVFTHPRLSKLVTLVIRSNEADNDTLDIVSKNCGTLERLGLVDAKVTGVGIKKLISSQASKLQQLALTDCEGVSEDTYEWVRKQGVGIWNRPTAERDKRMKAF